MQAGTDHFTADNTPTLYLLIFWLLNTTPAAFAGRDMEEQTLCKHWKMLSIGIERIPMVYHNFPIKIAIFVGAKL